MLATLAFLFGAGAADATDYDTPVVSNGPGTTITLSSGDTITGNFNGGYGLNAWGSGASASGNDIVIRVDNGGGVFADNAGQAFLANSTIIATNAGFKSGVIAQSGGSATIVNTDIDVSGTQSAGLLSTGSGSLIDATDVRVKVTGYYGLLAQSGGNIKFSGGSIETYGETYGLTVADAGSRIELMAGKTTSISTTGADSYGAFVDKGATASLDGADIRTAGSRAHAVLVANAGHVDLTNASIETSGDDAIGIRARNNSIANLTGSDARITTWGKNAHGVSASDSSTIWLTDATITTNGDGAQGAHSANNPGNTGGLVNMLRSAIRTNGENGYGVFVSARGLVTLTNSSITTTGDGGHGVVIGDQGRVYFNAGNSIQTSGANADAIHLEGAQVMMLDGGSDNLLPAVRVSGPGSAVLAAVGQNAHMMVSGSASLDVGMTAGPDTWGLHAEDGGTIEMGGQSNTGGTALLGESGRLGFTEQADAAGSRVRLEGNGLLDVSLSDRADGVHIGSLESDSATSLVSIGAASLTVGVDNAAGNGSLLQDTVYAGAFMGWGSGALVKAGAGTLSLTGGGFVGGVDVTGGTLGFDQHGTFMVANDYLTRSGSTTRIGQKDGALSASGTFTQESGATLDVTIGTAPAITAGNAALDGELIVRGFSEVAPVRASDIARNAYTLIRTTDGISGDFANVLTDLRFDYLLGGGHVSADGKDYDLSFRLAWTDGGAALGTGSFTLDKGASFEVDVPLADQSGTFASGWDGKSLTKSGEGTLILSATNSYSGDTTISGGTLQLAADDALGHTRSLNLGDGSTTQLGGYRQHVGALVADAGSTLALDGGELVIADGGVAAGAFEGSGRITLAGGNLDVHGANAALTADTAIAQGASLRAHDATSLGSGNADVAGTLVFDGAHGTATNTLSGTGELQIVGRDTDLTLTAADARIGSVDVREGTLAFAAPGAFTTTGDFTTRAGATTVTGLAEARLVVGGNFTQEAGATLDLTVGSLPEITARSATLDGTLVVRGFSDEAPGKASDIQRQQYTLIHTTEGIAGDFTNNPLAPSDVDYLLHDGHVSADGLDYQLKFRLAWTGGGAAQGTGVFTMAAGTGFEVDLALADQHGTFASGWDGESLTKNGEGTLTLSATNDYTGATTVNGGTLLLRADDALGQTSGLKLAANARTELGGYRQHVGTLATDSGSTLAFDGGKLVIAEGGNAAGTLSGNGGLTLAGGTLEVSGANTAFTAATDIAAGATLRATDAAALGSGAVNIAGTLAYEGAQGRIANTLGGSGELRIANSQLLLDHANPVDTITLANSGVVLGSADALGHAASRLTADSGSTLFVTRDGTALGNVNLTGGTIHIASAGESVGQGQQGAAGFKTLTLASLDGSGRFVMNSDLGAQRADLLVVSGAANGSHEILVRNSGAEPTAADPRQKLVQTEAGAARFKLANVGEVVELGTYRYTLATGSALGLRATDWYLVGAGGGTNDGGNSGDPGGNGNGGSTPHDDGSADSGDDGKGGGSTPSGENGGNGDGDGNLPPPPAAGELSNTADAAINLAAASTARETMALENATLLKRLGELRHGHDQGGTWARVFGNRLDLDNHAARSFSNQTWGMQFGADTRISDSDGGWYLGVLGGASQGDLTFREGGSGTLQSLHLGGYATRINSDGSYFDAVVKANRLDRRFTTSTSDGSVAEGGFVNYGYSASFEAGRQFRDAAGWYIEPQGQVAITHLSSGTFQTNNGMQVDTKHGTAGRLRAGAVVGRSITQADGGQVQPYVKANWVRETGSDVVRTNGIEHTPSLAGNRGEAGIGLAAATGAHRLYAEFDYSKGQRVTQPWGANVGYRFSW